MLKRWAETTDLALAERTAKICCLLGMMLDEEAAAALALALRASRLAESLPAESQQRAWCALAAALASYRCGKCDDAARLARAARDHVAMPEEGRVAARLVRAMALYKLDRVEEAAEALAEARAIELPREGTQEFHARWNDLLICQILRGEAETLLGAKK
jgi:hypothetical protein